ncbi:MAG: histidine triad nucleotide-binding protein [Armatimonadota bacterium]|nr:histidine triad nucleotide-binding protein [Armatimonadota bacterium]MCX7777250.1 histidine triad nucleotide-binding protein [Armatimonadota bacterium]MDW8024665.1 histidine triad nucleotide-binding protein [Armatimonadota bacterium]
MEMARGCIFCDIASGKVQSRIAYEDEDVIAFHDINPQAPIHILIIPKKHIANLNETSDDDLKLLSKLLLVARDIAKKEGVSERGYRIVLNTNREAGQSVFHIHFHLLGGRPFGWPPG